MRLIVIVCAYVIGNYLEPFSPVHSSGKKILGSTLNKAIRTARITGLCSAGVGMKSDPKV